MELNKIYQGDCLEVLGGFPDECIDLVITSPPYNLGNKHHTELRTHGYDNLFYCEQCFDELGKYHYE